MPNPQQERPAIPDDLLEHGIYHVLIPRIARHFELDPCPSIKAANEFTHNLMADVRAYLEWSKDGEDWPTIEQKDAEIARLKGILRAIHEALGEHPESDDASLPDVIRQILQDLRLASEAGTGGTEGKRP